MVICCPRGLVIDIGIVVVLVCALLGFLVSSILQSEGKSEKIFTCVSLKARSLIPCSQGRQAGLRAWGSR